jgi:hypothetical protein
MDNASNNDMLAKYLPFLIPSFRGMESRGRCFPHIINLLAKVYMTVVFCCILLTNSQIFISFFFRQPKKKPTANSNGELPDKCLMRLNLKYIVVTVVAEDDDSSDDDLAVEEEGIATDAASVPDDGRDAHDAAILKTTRGQAIEKMRERGVVIDTEEEKMALQLFPRVSPNNYYVIWYKVTIDLQVAGLARRVHDNSTLKEKFDNLVANDKDLSGDKTMLDRRVPTRWNSDLTCLDAHLYFRSPVEQLTGTAINKLQAYRLSEDQWNLAETLSAILEVTVLYCFGV